MPKLFGTDGVRGQVNQDLTFETAYKLGKALAKQKENSTILIGKDTRLSGDLFLNAFACGAINAGASIINLEVAPTPAISFLTQKLNCDFGVAITASHNPAEFNGIKFFNHNGHKLTLAEEQKIEQIFFEKQKKDHGKLGTIKHQRQHLALYKKFLVNSLHTNLNGLTIILDLANGACHKIAPEVFRKLQANVITTNSKPNGLNINDNCGSTHIQNIQKNIKKHNGDIGFAFDGDGDRVIAVLKNGEVLDGDKILLILAKNLHKTKKLKPPKVACTHLTNTGILNELKRQKIEPILCYIGDKFIIETLKTHKILLGAEQSGHVVFSSSHLTGDGILTALKLAEIFKKNNKKFDELLGLELYFQCNKNIAVNNNKKIINNKNLIKKIKELKTQNSRIFVRASGTEPVIRIMVECKNELLAKTTANEIETLVKKIDKDMLCAD